MRKPLLTMTAGRTAKAKEMEGGGYCHGGVRLAPLLLELLSIFLYVFC